MSWALENPYDDYEYQIRQSFSGQHQDDLLWLYLRLSMIDDIVDSPNSPTQREERAREILTELVQSDRFREIEGKYHIRAQDLTELTQVLIEIIHWPPDKSPFTSYDELETFNYRLISKLSRSLTPILFYEILSKDIHILTREYFENCFIQQMMGMQIINLINDVKKGKYFFPDELKRSDLRFLKSLGDEFISRAAPLRDPNVAGRSGSAFISALTHSYETLFALQL